MTANLIRLIWSNQNEYTAPSPARIVVTGSRTFEADDSSMATLHAFNFCQSLTRPGACWSAPGKCQFESANAVAGARNGIFYFPAVFSTIYTALSERHPASVFSLPRHVAEIWL